MKKMKMKRICALLLACVMLAATLPMFASALVYKEYIYSKYSYGICLENFYVYDTTDIVIPAEIDGTPVVRIASEVFAGNTAITSVVIPDSVTRIGDGAFEGCKNLKSVTLSENLEYVPAKAFNKCTSLESVNIPDSVTSIGSQAFAGCKALTEIKIGEGVEHVYSKAFADCSALEGVIPNSNDTIHICSDALDGTAFCADKANWDGGLLYIGNVLLKADTAFEGTAIIKDGITAISEAAFKDCAGFTFIDIPDTVKVIYDYAFSNCDGITDIVVPESVTAMGYSVFEYCDALVDVKFPTSLESLGNATFRACSALENIIIPDGITTIGSGMFINCDSLTKAVIPDHIEKIEQLAFANCDGLTEVVIPESVTDYEAAVFTGCTHLEKVTLPENMTEIPSEFFEGCTSLARVNIPESVKSIETWAFINCKALAEITLPEGLEFIGQSAFKNSGLTSIVVPESVDYISHYAFSYCENLSEIDLPDNGVELDVGIFERTKYSTDYENWETYTYVAPDGRSNKVNYALYVDGYLVQASPHIPSITLKEGTIGIAQSAFADKFTTYDEPCTIYINSDIKYISDYAFRYDDENKNIDYVVFMGDGDQWSNVHVDLSKNDWLRWRLSFDVEGDVDRDGFFTSSDLLSMRQCFAKMKDINELDSRNADANGDGAINAKDILKLKLKLAQ